MPVKSYTESLQQTLSFILSITKILHGEYQVLQITFEKKHVFHQKQLIRLTKWKTKNLNM